MSFIKRNESQGLVRADGWFLAHEECERKTRQVTQSMATTVNGRKYVPMGSFYPANNSSTVEGIVYEDVDVTTGDMPASVVLKGVVYLDRLPAAPESGVQSALEGKGFTFIENSPSAVRPVYPASLKSITVESAAGTAVGDTKLTLTYTKADDESYMYKVGTGTAPTIKAGEYPDNTWTAWDGDDDITAATDKKIAVIAVNGAGEAVAYGSATVTAKANG